MPDPFAAEISTSTCPNLTPARSAIHLDHRATRPKAAGRRPCLCTRLCTRYTGTR